MRTSNLVFGAMFVVGMLAQGCNDTKPTSQTGSCVPGEPGCTALSAGIDLSLTESGLMQGETISSVNFVYARDLWVRTRLPSIPRIAEVSLTFINPRGEISYEDRTPYSPDPNVKQMDSTLGHPISVFPAKSIPGGFALDRPIPIAGSVLQRIPAPEGIWEIQAVIDGHSEKLITQLEVKNQR